MWYVLHPSDASDPSSLSALRLRSPSIHFSVFLLGEEDAPKEGEDGREDHLQLHRPFQPWGGDTIRWEETLLFNTSSSVALV